MALVVDDKGKVTASPKTGKINDNSQTKPNIIVPAEGGRIQQVLPAAQPAQTYIPRLTQTHGQNRTTSLPSVHTASMSVPSEVEYVKQDDEPMSYWDNVQQHDIDTAKKLDERFRKKESALSPSFMSSDIKIEPTTNDHVAGEGDLNRWGEEYKESAENVPINTTWIGNTRTNDKYEDLFATGFNGEIEGMSPYDLQTTHGRGWQSMFSSGSSTPNMADVIDDGTMDYEHLTSPKVNGEQLKRYARNGMVPGMTIDQIEQINPDDIYDKTQLYVESGFRPYIPDMRTFADMAIDNSTNAVSKTAGELSNLRGNLSSGAMSEAIGVESPFKNPYMMNYNDGTQTMRINGPEFDEGAFDYMASVTHDREYNPRRFFDDSHENGGSWSQYATQWETQNPNGETEYHYGFQSTPYQSNYDGTTNLVFDDGSTVSVSDAWLESLYDPESNNFVIPTSYDGAWLIETPDGKTSRMYGSISDLVSNRDGTTNLGFSDGTTATMSDAYLDSLVPKNVRQDENGQWWAEFDEWDPKKVSDDYVSKLKQRKDGSYVLTQPILDFNGMTNVTNLGLTLDTAQLNGTDFPERYVDENGVEYDQLNNPDVASYWMPNYVMDDGTVLPYYDTLAIAGDTNGREENKGLREGQSIDYEFGPMMKFGPLESRLGPLKLTNIPSRLQPEPLNVENGEIDLSNLLSNGTDRIFDWTAASAPIMIPFTQWPASVSNAMQDFRGASSGRYDPYGNSYGYVSATRNDDGGITYDPGNDILDPRLTSGMSAGTVPVSEDLVGPVGNMGSGGRLLENLFEGPGLRNALGRWGLGWNSEGWEEVAGNVPEEFGQYGFSRSFGNYLDENGDVVATEEEAAKDERGLPIKQEWSPIIDRLYNFGIPMYRDGKLRFQPDALARNINSYIGGAAISALPSAIEEYGNMRDYNNQRALLDMMGLDFYQDPESVRDRHAPEGYLEQWR